MSSATPRECPICGHAAAADDRFCSNCGAPLESAVETTGMLGLRDADSGPLQPLEEAALAGLQPGEAVLLVRRGPNEGVQFPLGGEAVTAGRAPDAGVFLDDITVSRRHAEFRHEVDHWAIRDAGSLNGTYVNRSRIEEHQLVSGDEVQIGKYRFVFLALGSLA